MNITFNFKLFFVLACTLFLQVGCITQREAPLQTQIFEEEHHAICSQGAIVLAQEDEDEVRLNDYGCIYDNFSTTIEVGKTYIYKNEGEDIDSHFKVWQVLSGNTALVIRPARYGLYNREPRAIYEEVFFLIQSTAPYADGARLREGKYLCTGTRQCTVQDVDTDRLRFSSHRKSVQTVYILEEQKELP